MAALLLAGCGATLSSTQAARGWLQQSNFTKNQRDTVVVAHQVERLLRDPSSSALLLHTVCSVLISDVSQLNGSLPTPDAQATTQLSTAYDTIGNGANTCYNAAGHVATRTQALHFLRAGITDLFFAALRLHVAAGQGPS